MTRWGWVCWGTPVLTLARHGASAATAKRVLMVFREDSHVPAIAVSSTEEVPLGCELALKP
jgi:hypothetical protein